MPGLTGGAHILMERDLMENKYALVKGDAKIELDQKHFDPVFFAKSTEELRRDPEATKQLRKFQIFVKPDDIHVEAKHVPMSSMNNAAALEQLVKAQQQKDLAAYYAKQNKASSNNAAQSRIIDSKPAALTSNKGSSRPRTGSGRYAHVKSKVRDWKR